MKLVVSAIVLVLACSFASAQSQDWKEFTSTEGNFSVLMPDTPTLNIVTVDTASGRKQSNTFSYSDKNLNNYLVAYCKSCELNSEKFSYEKLFDKIRDGILIAQQGKLLSEAAITLNGYKGREIVLEGSDGIVQIQRFYFVNHYFYQLSVEIKKSEAKSEEVNRFLNSFRLLTPK